MNFQFSNSEIKFLNLQRDINFQAASTASASDEKMMKEINIKNNFQLMTNLSLFAY